MELTDMHRMFRQYAQQMGMQNVRAILPEQIDMFLNNSISDTVNQIIQSSVAITNDRVVTDNSKLGQVNALRELYTVYEVNSDVIGDIEAQQDNYYTEFDFPEAALFGEGDAPLFYVDFSIRYHKKGNKELTPYYPIRLIDDIYLADVLNDFILSPKFRSPVLTIFNRKGDNTKAFNLYIAKHGELAKYKIEFDSIRISYIKRPTEVCYYEDALSENVECNLPDYLHVDIVKHAVDLYHAAVQGSMMAAQGQQRQQQQEQVRNNARDDGQQSQQQQ